MIPETDHHVCSAAHCGMHGAVCEEEAEGRVMWVWGRVIGIRPAVGLTTATRNVGVALVIATAGFPDSAAVTAVIAVVMFQTPLLALIALWMGRFSSAPQAA